jgi:predicted MFS family arabinose efflux permease
MKLNRNLYLLALGVFGITTTEFGIIGVLPEIASAFRISIEKAGWLLSVCFDCCCFWSFYGQFTFILSKKKLLLASLFIFAIANLGSACIDHFYLLMAVRMIPAFFHPVYWSIALSMAEKLQLLKIGQKLSALFFPVLHWQRF